MRIVGIDPGSSTGMVCMDIDPSLDIDKSRWVGSARLHAGTSIKINRSMRDRVLYERVRLTLAGWHPEFVVLEEPFDARIGWRGKARQQTDTAFRLGAFYGVALGAVQAAEIPCVSYPIHDVRGERGWMGRTPHDHVLVLVAGLLRLIAGPLPADLSDDECMACGLIIAHVQRMRDDRMAEKIAARRAALASTAPHPAPPPAEEAGPDGGHLPVSADRARTRVRRAMPAARGSADATGVPALPGVSPPGRHRAAGPAADGAVAVADRD